MGNHGPGISIAGQGLQIPIRTGHGRKYYTICLLKYCQLYSLLDVRIISREVLYQFQQSLLGLKLSIMCSNSERITPLSDSLLLDTHFLLIRICCALQGFPSKTQFNFKD